MRIRDYVLLGLLALWLALALCRMLKRKKNGGCQGCGGCSGSCGEGYRTCENKKRDLHLKK